MTTDEFKHMVIPVGNKLFHFARMLLKDENEAKDAVQETYLKLWKMKDELAEIQNLEAFAMRLTRNWCLDRMKAKKPILVEGYQGRYDMREDTSGPHQELENSDSVRCLMKLMGMLPEQQRIILQLRDVQGYEFAEIAGITGMSVNTIRVNLSRARSKIRENLIKLNGYGQERSRHSAG